MSEKEKEENMNEKRKNPTPYVLAANYGDLSHHVLGVS